MATKTYGVVDPLWRWTDSLDPAQKQRLLEAVEANRSFARATAWSYLYDEQLGGELIDRALVSVQRFATQTQPTPTAGKLTARLHSQIRRIAKQMQRKSKEQSAGSLRDLELLAPSETPDPIESLYAEEVVKLLTPKAKEIAWALRMGLTWREIGDQMGIDPSSLHKAFRRESDAALIKLGRGVRIER